MNYKKTWNQENKVFEYKRSKREGSAEGGSRLRVARELFCGSVNVFPQYQQALLFPGACNLIGLDKEQNMKCNRAVLFITAGLWPMQDKWGPRSTERVCGIPAYVSDEAMLMMVSNVFKHGSSHPITSSTIVPFRPVTLTTYICGRYSKGQKDNMLGKLKHGENREKRTW